ncbi:arylamine N-acetyltransferase family protein [Kangiella shandongensis]|uniref:arylamine N-acetyltransferase family protein n=1 Tax=Kangiella shandongensis TaxID=2763258 RepID=UPI001CBCD3F0|nr:arylamine N-acetyltransferase [Kangiella shandongensis]
MQPSYLQQYLKRIHFNSDTHDLTPSLTLLNQLIESHQRTIPFESINPFLGIGVELEDFALQKKLLHSQRGGYCFEHNKLFSQILLQLGFRVESYAARVTLNQQSDQPDVAPTHRMSIVTLGDERYIADVGFGLHTPPVAVPLSTTGAEVEYHSNSYMAVLNGHYYQLRSRYQGKWKELYRFTRTPAQEADFDMANWYLTTHPESKFRNNLIATKLTPEGRISLQNNELKIYVRDGLKESQQLTSSQQVIQCLHKHFAIQVAKPQHLNEVLNHRLFHDVNANTCTQTIRKAV